MTAKSSPVCIRTIPRRQRAAVTVALGLSAGAVGWSGLAQAAGEETTSQVMLLPQHYELMDNGVVVFKLETGENLSLTSDQYLIMEDGLLLITDELAQASVYGLPVMGSIRAQLLSDLAPFATIDGTVAEATPSQTLAITQGTAPRLSEQVDLQSYELAQASDGSSSEVEEAVALSLSVSPGAMALLGMLMTSDQSEGEIEVEETPTPPAPPPVEFWTDADVADSASTAITGRSVDSFVGYTAASATATPDPLTAVGKGSGSVATFDMSAGGNNYFVAADHAGASSGSISYTGGSGDDNLTFGEYLARDGSATFDMSAGGNNTFVVDDSATTSTLAGYMGSLSYTGGAGNDSITINGDGLGYGGNVTIDMSAGGNNTFMTGHSAASGIGLSPSFLYTGGSATDSLTFGDNLAAWGSATFDMSAGGTNTFMAGSNAGMSGTVSYTGGMGVDIITFGSNASVTQEPATGDGASLNIDLGADTAADKITFQGSVGEMGGSVIIQNFDATSTTGDTIRLEGIAATSQLAIGSVPGGVVIFSTAGAATTIQMALDGNNAGDIDLTVVSGAVEIG